MGPLEIMLLILGMLGAACFIHERFEPHMDEKKLKTYLKRIVNRDRSKKENLYRGIQWHTRFLEARK